MFMFKCKHISKYQLRASCSTT